jgi:hypothetical protein
MLFVIFESMQQSKPMPSFVHDYLATGVARITFSLGNIRSQDNSIGVEALGVRISGEVSTVEEGQTGLK